MNTNESKTQSKLQYAVGPLAHDFSDSPVVPPGDEDKPGLGLRILYVASFAKKFNCESYVQHGLQENGAEVIRYGHKNIRGVDDFKRKLGEYNPNVILFSKATPKDCVKILRHCRDVEIPTATWIFDLYWGYRSSRPAQFKADFLFTTDGGHEKEFSDFGCNHCVLRQGIHAPEADLIQPVEFKYEVGFVGGTGRPYHTSRNNLVRNLGKWYASKFVHVTNTRGPALNELLSQIKIIVGDSYPTRNGHYWSNRVYEITGRGGFLMHPETPGLDDELENGKEYVAYKRSDYGQIKSLLNHYLQHDKERESIREAGFKRTSTQHTYTERCKRLCKVLQDRVITLRVQ